MRPSHKLNRPVFASLFGVMVMLALVSTTLAASSPNYTLGWFQIEAGGGENVTSPSYHLDSITAGQGIAGDVSSPSYAFHAGYQQAWSQLTPAPTPTDCPNVFVDVTGNIFYGAIHYLNCRGVVNGTDATHYSPAGTSTRGQFAKVVILGFGTPFYTPAAPDFSDVPATYFAYLYIETGFHAGILSGFDQNTCQQQGQPYPCYLPNRAITRGQLTKLVVNAAHYPLFTPAGGTQTFSDVPPSNVFFVSIETAHQKGVINGYPDQTFRPNNNIRRDEMAQIVYKGVTTP